ncbi:hypothetical protein Gotri_016834, partial [Gossypium trilobum]|nr:hypothetical protein [Gossypium trilobum]
MIPPVPFVVLIQRIFCKFYAIVQLLRMFGSKLTQTDSLEVVKSILGSSSTESNSALIRRICNILSQENHWILRYIPREYNQVGDCLAKQALIEKTNLRCLMFHPKLLVTLSIGIGIQAVFML